MNPDLKEALDLLEFYVHDTQVHTRKGAYTGKQQPLADEVQPEHWKRAKRLLLKHHRHVPISGDKLDG